CIFFVFLSDSSGNNSRYGYRKPHCDGIKQKKISFRESDSSYSRSSEFTYKKDIGYSKGSFHHQFQNHRNGQKKNSSFETDLCIIYLNTTNSIFDFLPNGRF